MINNINRRNDCGQSLVEFLVVSQIFLLFLAAIFPLLSSGAWILWLDERLWLRHFINGNQYIQSELHHAHRREMIPRYFLQKDLEETTELKKLSVILPVIKNFYPGYLKFNKIVANLPKEEWKIPGIGCQFDRQIYRNFTMLTPSISYSSDIPFLIRELSILGIVPWKIKLLENMKFELFHLNLDALPDKHSET